jgi:hypothetical protein
MRRIRYTVLFELVKHVLFTHTDTDEPGMRAVLHEEQKEHFNAGSLLEKTPVSCNSNKSFLHTF